MMLTNPTLRGRLIKKRLTTPRYSYIIKKATRKKVEFSNSRRFEITKFLRIAEEYKNANTEIYELLREFHPEYFI